MNFNLLKWWGGQNPLPPKSFSEIIGEHVEPNTWTLKVSQAKSRVEAALVSLERIDKEQSDALFRLRERHSAEEKSLIARTGPRKVAAQNILAQCNQELARVQHEADVAAVIKNALESL